MKCNLVFFDWVEYSNMKNSVYSTELGVELSMEDLHSGTMFEVEVNFSKEDEERIEWAYEQKEALPLFYITPNKPRNNELKDDKLDEELKGGAYAIKGYKELIDFLAPSCADMVLPPLENKECIYDEYENEEEENKAWNNFAIKNLFRGDDDEEEEKNSSQ